MALPSALARTPMFDARGSLNRAWLIYFNGLGSANGSSQASAYAKLNPGGCDVYIGLESGANNSVQLVLDGTMYEIHAPTVAGSAPSAGDRFTLYVDQDATGNRPFPAFDLGSGNFSADFNPQNLQPMLTASTRTALACVFHGDVWCLDSFRTNGSIT